MLTGVPTRHVQALVPSPGGGHVLVIAGGREPGLWLVATFSGRPSYVPVAELSGRVVAAAWSPDGSRIALATANGSDLTLYTVPAFGGRSPRVARFNETATDPASFTVGLTWRTDGTALLAATYAEPSGQAGAWEVPLGGGRPRQMLPVTAGLTAPPAWSPDGQWLVYYHRAEGMPYALHLPTGHRLHFGPWSPDGGPVRFQWQAGHVWSACGEGLCQGWIPSEKAMNE